MIIENIKKSSLEEKFFPAAIQKAINYLKQTEMITLSNGTYPISGNEMFMVVNEYQTAPKEEKTAEVHKKYIDLHYIISGKETVGVGTENPENELLEKYDEKKDRSKYKSVKNENLIAVCSGTYLILFPSEIHRPGCHYNETENQVKKAVIKISINLI